VLKELTYMDLMNAIQISIGSRLKEK